MNKKQIIDKIAKDVKKIALGETSGHDWWHINRVRKIAKKIGQKESNVNFFIVEVSALLHDIYDHKFYSPTKAEKAINSYLKQFNLSPHLIEQISYIILNTSYKGGLNTHKMKTIEGQIIQDADRLDALGAIGIARAFAYGGKVSREIYNPEIKPKKYKNLSEYKKQIKNNPTLNHFYEKLLLLKNTLHTQTAKTIAAKRHEFMEEFLKEFFQEWRGKK